MILKQMKLVAAFVALASASAFAQEEKAPDNWFNLDPTQDKVYGISTERAYADFANKKASTPIVVAIIDSGTDVEHEDLKDVLWTNPGEIAGNGIDDDKNGYIDDVHGWNFIGGPEGKHVGADSYELTRLYAMYKAKFDGKKEADISKRDMDDFKKYQDIKKKFEKRRKEAEQGLTYLTNVYEPFKKAMEVLEKSIGEKLTDENIKAFEPKTEEEKEAKGTFQKLYDNNRTLADLAQAKRGYDYYNDQVQYGLNPDFNPRGIVGDNYEDKKERIYGNNSLVGPDASHGTHVAGIVGAKRGNGIGMDGVADNVQLMVVRTVPNGDERDKDVANAIRYAVDNGAQVINMSFGKSYSPYKSVVDAAVRHAERKGVLLVHAAGNSAEDTDAEPNFPSPYYKGKESRRYSNWIEVGALDWKPAEKMPARFSNYGEKRVDLFAPGVDIYATYPNSEYKAISGTSMASPVVAGAAALLLSRYPELSAAQVRDILMESVIPISEEVLLPGSKSEKVKFADLARSGGVLSIYKAFELAEKTKGKRKRRNRIEMPRS